MIKIKKQFSVLLLTLVVGTSVVITGCQQTNTNEQSSPVKDAENDTEMRTLKITDMSGREVEIPTAKELKRVHYSNRLGQNTIYTINPEKMLALVSELEEDQLKLMPKAKDLKVEKVSATKAQVFIYMEDLGLDESSKQSADQLQTELGIPVIVVDGKFENRADAYRFLGQVFGEEERCERLALYCEEALLEVQTKAESIEETERVSIYYAQGKDGLSTEPKSSAHASVFKYVGAENVADVEAAPDSEMTPVTMDQILEWNPYAIFMSRGEDNPFKEITTGKGWSNLDAVRKGRVYESPNLTTSWIVRSQSPQQYLGLRYVGNILYPEIFNYDITKEVQDFFKLFYQVDISAEDANIMLEERLSE